MTSSVVRCESNGVPRIPQWVHSEQTCHSTDATSNGEYVACNAFLTGVALGAGNAIKQWHTQCTLSVAMHAVAHTHYDGRRSAATSQRPHIILQCQQHAARASQHVCQGSPEGRISRLEALQGIGGLCKGRADCCSLHTRGSRVGSC